MRNGHHEDERGNQVWYKNGKWHREDGPACIYPDGSQLWCINGELHREDGPAVIWPDGTQQWWVNGRLHREDGPAIIGVNGTKEWYLNGKYIIKEVNQWFEDYNLTYETMEFEDKMALKFYIRGLGS